MRRSDVHKLKPGQQVTVCLWRKGTPGVRRRSIIPNPNAEFIARVVRVTPNGGVVVSDRGFQSMQPYHAIVPNRPEVRE